MRRGLLFLVVALVVGTAVPAQAQPLWKQKIDRIVAGKSIGVSLRDHGTFLYRHADRTKRAPASNEKLLMTMALFKKIGTDTRLETSVLTNSEPVARIVAGDVYLSGKGDPSLTGGGAFGRSLPFAPTTLGVLARAIATTADRIEGSVIGNTGYFEHDWFAPGWSSNFPDDEVPLATSLAIEGNTINGYHFKNPEWRAAKALTRKLEYFGVDVAGRPQAGLMPEDASTPLATTQSVPVSLMARHMNRSSSNFFAEMFGKLLGAETFGAPGTIAKGADAIERYARRRGVTLTAHDSSGLSYANRVSPSGIVKLLGQAEAFEPFYETLRRDLPTGGQGTLEDRLHGVKLRAKTGSLNAVSALSGWIYLQRTDSWAEFSILSSGMSYYPSKDVEDRIVRLIEELAH